MGSSGAKLSLPTGLPAKIKWRSDRLGCQAKDADKVDKIDLLINRLGLQRVHLSLCTKIRKCRQHYRTIQRNAHNWVPTWSTCILTYAAHQQVNNTELDCSQHTLVPSQRRKGHKLEYWQVHLNVRKIFLLWQWLDTGTGWPDVKYPSLEISKTQLDMILSSLL